MIHSVGKLNQLASSELQKYGASGLSELLARLEAALLDEKNAIEEVDADKINSAGETIIYLLDKISQALPLKQQPDPAIKQQLLQQFKATRQLREANRSLLEENLKKTGLAIQNSAITRRALHAYYPVNTKNELFLKKDC